MSKVSYTRYLLIDCALKEKDDSTQIRIIDATKAEDDILLHEKLNNAEK